MINDIAGLQPEEVPTLLFFIGIFCLCVSFMLKGHR